MRFENGHLFKVWCHHSKQKTCLSFWIVGENRLRKCPHDCLLADPERGISLRAKMSMQWRNPNWNSGLRVHYNCDERRTSSASFSHLTHQGHPLDRVFRSFAFRSEHVQPQPVLQRRGVQRDGGRVRLRLSVPVDWRTLQPRCSFFLFLFIFKYVWFTALRYPPVVFGRPVDDVISRLM